MGNFAGYMDITSETRLLPKVAGGSSTRFNSSKETVAEVNGYAFAQAPERGIPDWILERYGVKQSISESDGRSKCYYFPYFNLECTKIIGYKKRDMSLDKNETGHFTMIGCVKIGAVAMFGANITKEIPRKKRLNIVEGEWDMLAAMACFSTTTDRKYAGKPPHIVSISHGAGNAGACVEKNMEFIKEYAEVSLGMDNDFASDSDAAKGIKKGKEATEEIANVLMSEETFQIEYRAGCKDACDMLLNGHAKDLSMQLLNTQKRVESAQVIRTSDITFWDWAAPKDKGVYIDCFPKLSSKMRGFRPSEITLLTSYTGAGKSTICGKLGRGFAKAGFKTGMVFLEEDKEESMRRIKADELGVNFNEFNLNPIVAVAKRIKRNHPMKQKAQCYAEAVTECANLDAVFKDEDKFCYHSDFGAIASIQSLLNEFRTMVYVHGCKYIILDHISIAVANANVKDERQALDIMMAEMGAFAKKHKVHIIIVSHLNRNASSAFKNKKDEEAYWAKVVKEDLRGSSALEGVAFTIIAIEIQIVPDRSRGLCRLTILKNRPTGWMGECDTYTIDDETGEFILMNEQEDMLDNSITEDEWDMIADEYFQDYNNHESKEKELVGEAPQEFLDRLKSRCEDHEDLTKPEVTKEPKPVVDTTPPWETTEEKEEEKCTTGGAAYADPSVPVPEEDLPF